MPRMIPITKMDFGPEELAAVQRVLESGWLVQGRELQKFEESVAEFCDISVDTFNNDVEQIELLEGRPRCATLYDPALEELSWLTRPAEHAGRRHSYQSYVCLFSPETPLATFRIWNASQNSARRCGRHSKNAAS